MELKMNNNETKIDLPVNLDTIIDKLTVMQNASKAGKLDPENAFKLGMIFKILVKEDRKILMGFETVERVNKVIENLDGKLNPKILRHNGNPIGDPKRIIPLEWQYFSLSEYQRTINMFKNVLRKLRVYNDIGAINSMKKYIRNVAYPSHPLREIPSTSLTLEEWINNNCTPGYHKLDSPFSVDDVQASIKLINETIIELEKEESLIE